MAGGDSSADLFGNAICINSDGNEIYVGVPGRDLVLLFNTSGALTDFALQYYLNSSRTVSGDRFGFSCALTPDDLTLLVGAPSRNASTGTVHIFSRSTAQSSWIETQTTLPYSPAVGEKFGVVLGAAPNNLELYVGSNLRRLLQFVRNSTGAAWAMGLRPLPIPCNYADGLMSFGNGIGISPGSDIVYVGLPGWTNRGMVFSAVKDNGAWGFGRQYQVSWRRLLHPSHIT